MKAKKIVGLILQIPLYVLVVGSFIASIYAAAYEISGVGWSTPIILAGIMIAYIIGTILRIEKKENNKKYDGWEKYSKYVDGEQ